MRCALYCLALFSVAAPATAQLNQSLLPPDQTQDGITLRVTKAGFFDTLENFEGFFVWGNGDARRSGYSVGFQVLNDKAPVVKPELWSRTQKILAKATTARLFAPSGELLTPSAGAKRADGPQQLKWVTVDPRWDHVTLEVLAFDPAAPIEATGCFFQTLAFKDVPTPPGFDQAMPVGAILRTERGTAITLDSVTMRSLRGVKGKISLEFNFQWEAPRTVPDLTVESLLEEVLDAKGEILPPVDGNGILAEGNRFRLRMDLLKPPHRDEMMTVRAHIEERSGAWRQKQHYRRFLCRLKLPNTSEALSVFGVPAQIFQAESVIGALEQAPELGQTNLLQTWLWLRGRDEAIAPGPAREWFIKALAAHDQDGRQLEAGWDNNIQNDTNYLAWRSDGMPAAPGERSRLVQINWGATRPRAVLLEAEVEERLHRHRLADFADVPIPAQGQTREINAVVAASAAGDAPGASVILRRIARVADPKPAAFFPGWPRQDLRAGSLALVFEVVPALAQGTIDFRGMFAEDEVGNPLHDENGIPAEAGDITGSIKGKGWFRTLLLHPPLPGAKNLRVQVVVDETKATGKEATLRFPDVPLPVLKTLRVEATTAVRSRS